jgi:hypothetical protein
MFSGIFEMTCLGFGFGHPLLNGSSYLYALMQILKITAKEKNTANKINGTSLRV